MVALEAVAGANTAGITLVELAARCGMPAGSTHRVIQTLLDSGLIARRSDLSKEYVLADRLFRLVQTATDSRIIGSAVQGTLDQLAAEVGETCFVARLIDRRIVSVAWATPESGLRTKVYPGDVLPAHAAASAKAILAHQDEAASRDILGPAPEQLTPRTRTDWRLITEEYAGIRDRGIATCWDEMDLGLSAIAVPIVLSSGQIHFSLGLTGLTPRIRRFDLDAARNTLESRAKALSSIIQTAAYGRGKGPGGAEVNRR